MEKIRQGGFLIARIHQLAGRIFTRKLKEYHVEEINPAQGRILFALWQHDGIAIQELSHITSLGQSTLTSMLDRLEESGYLKRVQSTEDRRKILIRLTNRDDRVRSAYEKAVCEMSRLFYKGFSEQEIDLFEQRLLQVLENLEQDERQGRYK